MFIQDRRILIKVAQMYYEEGATQSEVAKKIGISRSLVSKLLTKAREEGIVEIIIHETRVHQFRNLERKIERLYDLRDVVCIESVGLETSKKQLGEATSEYLQRVIRDGQIIGLSSGTTLNEVAKAIHSVQLLPTATIVPLVGGMGNERVDIHSNSIVSKIGNALKAKYELLHVPVMVDTKEAKEVLIRQPSIRSTLDLAEQSQIAIVGIGGRPEDSTMVKSYLGLDHQQITSDNEIVGDICYNFINKFGKQVDNAWNDRVIAIELEKLKAIPLVIGVASGLEKVSAIKAALEGGLIHVLITDGVTGSALVE
ncbi:sugar-binding transcriptional regulator [Niallia taxi]|uniref:sugar-binding transcriptional regulator n=1 Tax=Niallia taxi TaxID=2499688 RepID=UPI001F3C4A9B|nr:sugar-binding transcriptional regulator [Niallia taxi]MCM3214136.1 sugar-binding transcriptional regulator [Niallia taxi]MDK8640894.1 sugar-binding transcriptional regulator [Niallia taxi]MED4040901.1 sugar-binding transcriptional regulator [Niallia taxi]MED4052820.1 sugar-binding transcriptional regulator [Niallia taxi]MED4120175.1 sugar-binding transcriptional regulator [Niallia taxi]